MNDRSDGTLPGARYPRRRHVARWSSNGERNRVSRLGSMAATSVMDRVDSLPGAQDRAASTLPHSAPARLSDTSAMALVKAKVW